MKKSGALVVLLVVVLAIFGYVNLTRKQDTVQEPASVDMMNTSPDSDLAGSAGDSKTMVQEIKQISLTVTSPGSGTTVNTANVSITGKTVARAEVFANEAEGFADASGNFRLTVSLDEGENSIIVTAVDENGNVAEKEIIVTYTIAQ